MKIALAAASLLLVAGGAAACGDDKSGGGGSTASKDDFCAAFQGFYDDLQDVTGDEDNLGEILKNFRQVLIPEINNGQLIKIIRNKYFVDAKGYHKIMGVPITKTELVMKVRELLGGSN